MVHSEHDVDDVDPQQDQTEMILAGKDSQIHDQPLPVAINSIYFSLYAGIGSVSSFMPLFLFSKGLSYGQVGLLGVIRPMVSFVGTPFWAFLADSTGLHPQVFVCCMFVSTLARLLYLTTSTFGVLLPIIAAVEFVGSGPSSMIDTAVMSSLIDPRDWGRHRLWGAVGFGSAVLLVGILTAHDGGWRWMFGLHCLLMLIATSLVRRYLRLTCLGKSKRSDAEPENSWTRVRKLIAVICGSWENIVFYIVVLLCGMCTGVIENFLFIFLQDDLDAGQELIGASRSVTCAAEVPMFWFSGALIKRYGVMSIVALACGCYALRFFLYSVLMKPWMVLLIEPLHGFTYATMWSASTSYAYQIAPNGMEATSQALISGLHWGLGQGLGAVFGGLLNEAFGARVTFRHMMLLSIFNMVAMGWSVFTVIPKR